MTAGPDTSTRGARTAARLRDAAVRAFTELGWQATRVQDIVERAGVSHGTFYSYYDNKTAALVDLVRSSQADLDDLASQPWGAEDPRVMLERIIGGVLDLFQRDAPIMRAWYQAARDERDLSALYLAARGRFIDRVEEQVQRVVAASGRTGMPPARTVASALAAMVEHFAYCWAVLGEEHDRDDAMAALVLLWGSAINGLAGFEVVSLG